MESTLKIQSNESHQSSNATNKKKLKKKNKTNKLNNDSACNITKTKLENCLQHSNKNGIKIPNENFLLINRLIDENVENTEINNTHNNNNNNKKLKNYNNDNKPNNNYSIDVNKKIPPLIKKVSDGADANDEDNNGALNYQEIHHFHLENTDIIEISDLTSSSKSINIYNTPSTSNFNHTESSKIALVKKSSNVILSSESEYEDDEEENDDDERTDAKVQEGASALPNYCTDFKAAMLNTAAAEVNYKLENVSTSNDSDICEQQNNQESDNGTKEKDESTVAQPKDLIETEFFAQQSGVNVIYKEYESELEMPDIMRLIQKDLSEPYSIYTYRYFIHNWPKLCFLALHDSTCVGAIVCKLDTHRQKVKRGYIAMLAVDKDYRKLKIGTTLVRKAINAMLSDDADEVVLETEITNQPALRLYENLGFVRDKRLFHYYLNGVDALRLKLWFR